LSETVHPTSVGASARLSRTLRRRPRLARGAVRAGAPDAPADRPPPRLLRGQTSVVGATVAPLVDDGGALVVAIGGWAAGWRAQPPCWVVGANGAGQARAHAWDGVRTVVELQHTRGGRGAARGAAETTRRATQAAAHRSASAAWAAHPAPAAPVRPRLVAADRRPRCDAAAGPRAPAAADGRRAGTPPLLPCRGGAAVPHRGHLPLTRTPRPRRRRLAAPRLCSPAARSVAAAARESLSHTTQRGPRAAVRPSQPTPSR